MGEIFRMSQWGLLASARFLPLFLTQALGALNDNVFRNALIVLVTFRLTTDALLPPAQLAAVATGLFILPYFLFSALVGQISDRYEKSRVIRVVKLAEIFLSVLAAIAFAMDSTIFLLAVLFLLGTQSTFFSPVKFAILPQQLDETELLGANAFLELGTFITILAGAILGTVLILGANGPLVVSVLMIAVAIAGYLSARAVPPAPASAPGLVLNLNLAAETVRLLRFANQSRTVLWGIIGIAWFWLLGGLYVTQLAAYTKFAIGANQTVVTLLLGVFTIGIGAGALLCNRLLRSVISPRLVLASAVGLSVFAVDLWFVTMDGPPTDELIDVGTFLASSQGWRITASLFLLALFAGIYSVPLYALVQARSDPSVRARTIAAANIIIAMFMVTGALTTTALLGSGLKVQEIFALAAAVNIAAAFLIHRKLAAADTTPS